MPPERRVEGHEIGSNCYRVNLHYGYMQETNIPRTLANARYDQLGFFYEPLQISYFLSRKTVVPSSKPGMASWRERLFAWMVRSSVTPMDFFCLPVIELWNWAGKSRSDYYGGRHMAASAVMLPRASLRGGASAGTFRGLSWVMSLGATSSSSLRLPV